MQNPDHRDKDASGNIVNFQQPDTADSPRTCQLQLLHDIICVIICLNALKLTFHLA
jgi:hypothetical protein